MSGIKTINLVLLFYLNKKIFYIKIEFFIISASIINEKNELSSTLISYDIINIIYKTYKIKIQ